MLFFYLPWVEVSWHTEQGLGGWCEEAEVVFCIHGDVRGSHVQVFVLGGKRRGDNHKHCTFARHKMGWFYTALNVLSMLTMVHYMYLKSCDLL